MRGYDLIDPPPCPSHPYNLTRPGSPCPECEKEEQRRQSLQAELKANLKAKGLSLDQLDHLHDRAVSYGLLKKRIQARGFFWGVWLGFVGSIIAVASWWATV